jgi:hypothetical protein
MRVPNNRAYICLLDKAVSEIQFALRLPQE